MITRTFYISFKRWVLYAGIVYRYCISSSSLPPPLEISIPAAGVLDVNTILQLDDDFVSFRHTEAWPVLGPYMGRVSPECTVIRPVRGLTYDYI
jgi:hypothetical protein